MQSDVYQGVPGTAVPRTQAAAASPAARSPRPRDKSSAGPYKPPASAAATASPRLPWRRSRSASCAAAADAAALVWFTCSEGPMLASAGEARSSSSAVLALSSLSAPRWMHMSFRMPHSRRWDSPTVSWPDMSWAVRARSVREAPREMPMPARAPLTPPRPLAGAMKRSISAR